MEGIFGISVGGFHTAFLKTGKKIKCTLICKRMDKTYILREFLLPATACNVHLLQHAMYTCYSTKQYATVFI
jgi:hypothetical protein